MKRRNENGQMRREEYEAADDDASAAESFDIGFQRASEEAIRKRKIVKARSGSRPLGATTPKAAAVEDNAATSTPFEGFQGLTAAKPAASNPFAGFSGLTSASSPGNEKTRSGSSAASSKSYQQAMEGLNKEFLAFVTGQLQRNPSASWIAAVQEYVEYAAEIATKYASTKPVIITETKRVASAPFSCGATPAPASIPNPATAPSSSSSSFNGSNASAKTKDKTLASSELSLGGASKKDDASTRTVLGGLPSGGASKKDDASTKTVLGGLPSGGAGSSFFSVEPLDREEKTIPAFSFGALPKPTAPADSSTPASGGFSFGNAPAVKSIASASSGGLGFGVSASAASTSTPTGCGDADDENIGREEATVIIKADSLDDDCTFEADKVKIFEFKKDEKRWADKGVHPLKVLVSKDTKRARLLVRNEIGKVVLNAALYKGMTVRPHETKGKRTGVTLALQVDQELTQFLIKVNAARVDDLITALEAAIM